jgi:hypothetical protein
VGGAQRQPNIGREGNFVQTIEACSRRFGHDPCGSATITTNARGRGEVAFGALEAGLEIAHGRASIGFTWIAFDEGDEVSGEGSAELLDDGPIEIEFAYHNGDEAIFEAKREPFQQPAKGLFSHARELLSKAAVRPKSPRAQNESSDPAWRLAIC